MSWVRWSGRALVVLTQTTILQPLPTLCNDLVDGGSIVAFDDPHLNQDAVAWAFVWPGEVKSGVCT